MIKRYSIYVVSIITIISLAITAVLIIKTLEINNKTSAVMSDDYDEVKVVLSINKETSDKLEREGIISKPLDIGTANILSEYDRLIKYGCVKYKYIDIYKLLRADGSLYKDDMPGVYDFLPTFAAVGVSDFDAVSGFENIKILKGRAFSEDEMAGKLSTKDFYARIYPVIISSELADKFGIELDDLAYAGAGLAGDMKMIADETEQGRGYFFDNLNSSNIALKVIGIFEPADKLEIAVNNATGLKLSDCFILPLPLLDLVVKNLYAHSDAYRDDSIKYAEYTVANREDAIGLLDYAKEKGVDLKSYQLYSSVYDELNAFYELETQSDLYRKLSVVFAAMSLAGIAVFSIMIFGRRKGHEDVIVNA